MADFYLSPACSEIPAGRRVSSWRPGNGEPLPSPVACCSPPTPGAPLRAERGPLLQAALWLLLVGTLLHPLTARAADAPGEAGGLDRFFTTLHFEPDELTIRTVDDYDWIQLAGATTPLTGDQPGSPALPVWAVRFLLPPATRIAGVRVMPGDAIEIPGSFMPVPQHAHATTGDSAASPPTPDPAIYNSEQPYPVTPAAGSSTGWMRGHTIGTVLVQPMQYVGAGGMLRLFREIRLAVAVEPLSANEPVGIRHRSARRTPHSSRAAELAWLRGQVVNPTDLSILYGDTGHRSSLLPDGPLPFAGFLPTEFPSVDGPPVEYVIVTDSLTVGGRHVGDLVTEFSRLARWKTATGTPAVVRTVGWIRAHYPGHDDAARIRAFLIEAYELWGTDYVLLGGDLRIVPARRFNGVNLGSGDPPADCYYGGLDNEWDVDRNGIYGEHFGDVEESDPYWDAWVGRAPVENRQEAAVFVDKCLIYARAPGVDLTGLDPHYYERMVLLNGLGNCAIWGYTCNGIYVGEAILRRKAPPGIDVTRIYQRLLDPEPTCAYHETYVEVADSTQITWTVDSAMIALGQGVGFVHHFEHSNPYSEGGASSGFGCEASLGGALGREYIDMLSNRPNWPIVLSTGAGVNAFDYESVSEHWVLNPDGGAVAYIGKTRSGSIGAVTGEVDTLVFGQMFQDGVTVGQAMAFATQSVAIYGVAAVSSFNLLGEPQLQPWLALPAELDVQLNPPLVGLGEQLLEVEVLDAVSQAPVAGARVALEQSSRLYTRGLSDAGGGVRFAVNIEALDDLTLTVTAPGYLPVVIEQSILLSTTPWVSYVSHAALDDSAGMANGNGIVDAGEVLKLDVTVENIGLGGVAGTAGELQAIGGVDFELVVDTACRPEMIFFGAADGHPPAGACTARFPELEFAGVQPIGPPAEYVTETTTGCFIWRDGGEWQLIVRGEDGPLPPVVQFEGTIVAYGGIDGVSAGDLEQDDEWSLIGSDTLTFSFEISEAGDHDRLVFSAREVLWLTVTDSLGAFGRLDPGESATDRFIVEFTHDVPDRHAPRFELGIQDILGGPVGRSSFTVPVVAPELDYAWQSVEFEVSVPDVSGTIVPVVRNRGTGDAADVRAVLRLVAGEGSVTDSTIVFGAIPGGATIPAPGGAFSFATPDTLAVRFAVEIASEFPDGTSRSWQAPSIDVLRPCAPRNLVAGPTFRQGSTLRWSAPAAGCSADLAGYNLFRRQVDEEEFECVALLDSTQACADIELGDGQSWVYALTARDSSGNLSVWSEPITVRTWVAEHAGWPRTLDAGTPSSPIAIDVDGDGSLEIFALGYALYGWRADGTPLVPAHEDGVVFRPHRPREHMAQAATGAFFGSPAAADLDGDGTIEIVIAAWDDSLWVVRPDGELLWGSWCVPKFSSPSLGDLDGDGDLEIVIGSDQPKVYAWHHDGTPVMPSNPDGKLADLPDGARINYTTPALAEIDGDESTLEVIYASFAGNVYAWDGTGALLWSHDVGPNRPLSTPAVGDVDGDGRLEVVVAQGNVSTGPAANALYVIDAEQGESEMSWSGEEDIPGVLFSNGNLIHPPSLADLDADGDLEILLGTSGVNLVPPYLAQPGAATVLVFHHDDSTGFSLGCTDAIPEPGLNMINMSGETVNAQPVVADLGRDDVFEVVAGSTTFGLFMFGIPVAENECASRDGWPMLLSGEIDATPLIADIDNDGSFDLLVRSYDGEIHLLDLDEPFAGDLLQWGQFAHDSRHTSNYGAPLVIGLPDTGAPALPFSLAQNVPNPCRTPTRIEFAVSGRNRVRLRIYGVDGRLVRTLVDRVADPGRHAVRWNGRDARGREVPTGVYFYRLEAGGDSLARKLIRIR